MRKYIKEYYRKQKKRKRDNDRKVTEASNKTKAMWQSINRENGKSEEDDNKLEKRYEVILFHIPLRMQKN